MVSAFNITPSYYAGHLFTWCVLDTCAEARPWVFSIEVSPDGVAEWSPVVANLVNVLAWQQSDKPGKYNRDLDPFYRVVMTTGTGNTYYSGAKGCYGDLPRRDYLLAKEMMRKELLMLRKSSGVVCELWKKMKTGIKCRYCTDPVTGEVVNTKCTHCLGAQYEGGYTGPYEVWASFGMRKSSKKFEAGGYGLTDGEPVQISLIGHPFINADDVVVDRGADRRYAVQTIDSRVEVRRVPILTVTSANELTMTDMAYKLGHADREDDTCGNDRPVVFANPTQAPTNVLVGSGGGFSPRWSDGELDGGAADTDFEDDISGGGFSPRWSDGELDGGAADTDFEDDISGGGSV